MALQSDVPNPDYQLIVRFYDGTTPSEFESSQTGRRIVKDVCRINVRIPGNQLLERDEPATDEDKARFPMQYQHYLNNKGGVEMGGTPIDELTFISAAAKENLKAAKFFTVEQIANGSDQQLMSLGMSVGMNPLAMREKALHWLSVSEKNSGFTQVERQLEEERASRMALEAQLQSAIVAIEELKSKRGPGRPRKDEEEAA